MIEAKTTLTYEKPEPARPSISKGVIKRLQTRLVWNVIYYDRHLDRIGIFNIFDHREFLDEVQKSLKNCDAIDSFADKLCHSLLYYFRYKYEWEIVIRPWSGGRDTKEIKVDVYWQVLNNWDRFLEYVWSTKSNKDKANQ